MGAGLVSLSAFFLGLILAYSFRIETEATWQRFRVPGFLWISTLVLALSSGTMEAARFALRRASVSIYRTRLVVTAGLGALFLSLQITAGLNLWSQGVAASANPHGSAFYVFMGIHGIHLSGGAGWLFYLYRRSRRLRGASENELRLHRRIVSVAAWYWHFMGVVWAVLFYFLLRWTN